MSGYFKIHRKIFKNTLLFPENEKFNRYTAWCWMLSRAAFEDGGGLRRGELAVSFRYLSGCWGWSKDRIERFFDALEADGAIKSDRTRTGTVITILNYAEYQDFPARKKPGPDTNKDANKDANKDTYKEITNNTLTNVSVESAPPPKKKRKKSSKRLTPDEKHAHFLESGKTPAKGCKLVYFTKRDRELIREYWTERGMTLGDMVDGVRRLEDFFRDKNTKWLESEDHRASMQGWVFDAMLERKGKQRRAGTAQAKQEKQHPRNRVIRAGSNSKPARIGDTVLDVIKGGKSNSGQRETNSLQSAHEQDDARSASRSD